MTAAMMTTVIATAIAVATGMLSGCSGFPSRPKPAGLTDAAAAATAQSADPIAVWRDAFERAERMHALALEQQGRLEDASTAWDILALIAPATADDVAHRNALQERIAVEVDERLRRAAAAARHGDAEAAARHDLAVLALQPHHQQAADDLRRIESERRRRQLTSRPRRGSTTARAGDDALAVAEPASAPVHMAAKPHTAAPPVRRGRPGSAPSGDEGSTTP